MAPSSATEAAKALQQQPVDKGKIWLLFLGGAVTLFGGTVLLENVEALFPAISRSNKLMSDSRKQEQVSLQLLSDMQTACLVLLQLSCCC